MINVNVFGQQQQSARERRSDYGNNSNLFLKKKSRAKKRLALATSIEPSKLAHPCSLTRLYTAGYPSSHLIISQN